MVARRREFAARNGRILLGHWDSLFLVKIKGNAWFSENDWRISIFDDPKYKRSYEEAIRWADPSTDTTTRMNQANNAPQPQQ